MNEYEAKKEERAQRADDRAEKARERSNQAFNNSSMSEANTGIPFGQPILVGHHSEGAHRAAIKRADNAMRKSIQENEKANYYAGKAEAIRNDTSISSDDPDVVKKLKAKIETAEHSQRIMKACNKIIKNKKLIFDGKIIAIKELLPIEGKALEILTPNCMGTIGFPSYALTNNNANIRRMKGRLAKLDRQSNDVTQEFVFGENKVLDNVEDNRVQIFFPGKPSEEIRTKLKRSGFKWSPANKVWQRFRGTYAMQEAKTIAQIIE